MKTAPTPDSPRLTPARVAAVAVWIAALWGVLQLRRFGDAAAHSFCGPWGCGPPTLALLGVHGFWTAVLVPAAVLSARRVSRRTAVRGAAAAVAIGLAGTAAHVGWDLWASLDPVTGLKRRYVAQRMLFAAMNQTDVPLLPLAAAGVAGWVAAWRGAAFQAARTA